MSSDMKVLLVGAGNMAGEYAKVLSALNVSFDVIGRSMKTAEAFKHSTGVPVFTGSIEEFVYRNGSPSTAIVAVSMDQLANVTKILLMLGVKNILVEKPGGLNTDEVRSVAGIAQEHRANVFIAYNRRFYASVTEARKIIESDGGVTSFQFEFTEWAHTIEKLEHAPGVLENWFLANSSHVVDTAFFLGGRPVTLSSYALAGLRWHKIAIYAGAGVSDKGALFSYHANWCSPGRWSIEIMTNKHRLLLKPMERLQIQQIGSIQTEFLDIDDSLDRNYKPGIYHQLLSFLEKKHDSLLSIAEHVDNLRFYESINSLSCDMEKTE